MLGYHSFEVRRPRTASPSISTPQHKAPSFKPPVIVSGAPLGPRNPNLHRNIHKRPRQLPQNSPSHPAITKFSSPIQHPKTFIARIDKDKKDLIITAGGITRNAVYVTERYLPNGDTYQTYSYDFSKENGYDFVKAVGQMSKELKEETFEKLLVEIVVDIEPSTVDNGKQKIIEGRKGVASALEDDGQVVSVIDILNPTAHHSRHEAVDLSQNTANLSITIAEPNKRILTVLDQLSELGTTILPLIKKLQLTLSFPTLSNPPSTLGPGAVSSQSQALTSSHLHSTPSWIQLNSIADALEAFTALTSLTINLLVPSNTRTSLNMEQIYHLLPFYDLSFTDWEMTYQPKGMSFQHPIKGWCVRQLDRERERLVRERRNKDFEAKGSTPRYLRRQVVPKEILVEEKGKEAYAMSGSREGRNGATIISSANSGSNKNGKGEKKKGGWRKSKKPMANLNTGGL